MTSLGPTTIDSTGYEMKKTGLPDDGTILSTDPVTVAGTFDDQLIVNGLGPLPLNDQAAWT